MPSLRPMTKIGWGDAPPYSRWANDPAYVALRELTDGTTAQRANVKPGKK